MRLLVTRPASEAAATARALRARGHEVLASPVLEVVPTGAPLPAGSFDLLLATSAQAIDALSEAAVAQLAGRPLHVVGTRTAAAARKRGLGPVATVAADGAKLAATLREAGLSSRSVLYLAGRQRKPDLEQACARLDLRLTAVETYEARPAACLTDAAVAALRGGALDGVLHYSRRSAELFLALADAAGLAGRLAGLRHACLSEDVAAPLRARGLAVVVAGQPRSESLFAALETG